MRPRARSRMQGLIVAGVVVLAGVAAVDAVRRGGGDGDGAPRRERANPPRVEAAPPLSVPVESLRRAGAEGVLVWTDAACRLHALRLPEGREVPLPDGPDVGCRFELSPDGRRVAPRGARWGTSTYYAVCSGRAVHVYHPPDARARHSYDGCVPAWRPTRAGPLVLTLVRDGRVLEVRPACEGQPPCEDVVLDEGSLAAAVEAADPSGGSEPIVLDLDWESPERVRVLLLLRPGLRSRHVVATYDSGEFAFVAPLGREPFRDEGVTVRDGRAVVFGVSLPLRARDAALAREQRDVTLVEAGVSGTLVYTTADGCGLRAVRLPGLEAVPPPRPRRAVGCRFELSPDGGRAAEQGAAWSLAGPLLAVCSGARTRVVDARTDRTIRVVDGCAPSWRGPSALVVAERDRVVQWHVGCRRGGTACAFELLDRAALERVARRHPNRPDADSSVRLRVLDLAPLARKRLAVLLEETFVSAGRELGPWQSVAVFAEERLLWDDHAYGTPLVALDARPLGDRVLAEPTLAFTGEGGRLPVPDTFGEIRAGAWSPDERWLAVAARGAIVFLRVDELERFGTTGRPPEPIKLPIDAADLAWR